MAFSSCSYLPCVCLLQMKFDKQMNFFALPLTETWSHYHTVSPVLTCALCFGLSFFPYLAEQVFVYMAGQGNGTFKQIWSTFLKVTGLSSADTPSWLRSLVALNLRSNLDLSQKNCLHFCLAWVFWGSLSLHPFSHSLLHLQETQNQKIELACLSGKLPSRTRTDVTTQRCLSRPELILSTRREEWTGAKIRTGFHFCFHAAILGIHLNFQHVRGG